jgi:integrase
MSIYKRPGSRFLYWEFQHAGKKIVRATGCKAERAARSAGLRIQAAFEENATIERVLGMPNASLKLGDAALRYWSEVRDKHASGSDTHRDLLRLVEHFGENTLLSQIDDDAVAGLVVWRRAHRTRPHNAPDEKVDTDYPPVSPATVNHTIVRLQALFTHAKKKWKDDRGHKVKFANEPTWSEHKLPVVKKPARVLKPKESKNLDATTRDDYGPFQAFAHASGRRFFYCYSLKWTEVDFDKRIITKDGKRKPDGTPKEEPLPITDKILTILKPLRGHHPIYVFTYIARVHRAAWKEGATYTHKATGEPFVAPWNQRALVKGQRYPLLRNTAKTAFRRAVERAGIENFGFHGIRRTRANEIHKATGDVRMVQKQMGHTSIATTERYLENNLADVRAAMEKADKLQRSPTVVPYRRKRKAA